MRSISFSEATTLAHCEVKHQAIYAVPERPEEDGSGLRKGRWWSQFMGFWWQGVAEERHPLVTGLTDIERDDMHWLRGRYIEQYGWKPPADWKVVGTEVEIRAPIPGTDDLELHGRADVVVERPSGLWVVEDKTYGKRDRLEYVHVSFQETLMAGGYQLQTGRPVEGVIFNGVYTYHWKPTFPTQAEVMAEREMTRAQAKAYIEGLKQRGQGIERPVWESFDRIETGRSQEMYDHAWKLLARLDQKRRDLEAGAIAVPNVGPLCKRCFNKYACFGGMLGEEDYGDVVVVDE